MPKADADKGPVRNDVLGTKDEEKEGSDNDIHCQGRVPIVRAVRQRGVSRKAVGKGEHSWEPNGVKAVRCCWQEAGEVGHKVQSPTTTLGARDESTSINRMSLVLISGWDQTLTLAEPLRK